MSRSPNAQRLVPCMPPLLEEETIPLRREDGSTKFGGNACEDLVKVFFLSQGINVATPLVDEGADLLIEKPEGWVRGQVKKVVYQSQLDYGMNQRSGVRVYRSRYNFNFQGGGATAPHLKNGRRQRGPENVDYFYHVLMTKYRQLIWETPVSMIPLRKDGKFIHGKCPNPLFQPIFNIFCAVSLQLTVRVVPIVIATIETIAFCSLAFDLIVSFSYSVF